MTYVIALQLPDITAFISDCRVTYSDGTGEDNRIKLGLLAPGIMFARVGDEEGSARFIAEYQKTIRGTTGSLPEYWRRLEEFVESYNFHSERYEDFQLILSTRAFGCPQLFELSSSTGKINALVDQSGHDPPINTFGIGKEILDSYVMGTEGLPHPLTRSFLERLLAFMAESQRRGTDKVTSQVQALYYLCLWLSELTLTSERTRVNNAHVGGPFYFMYQTNDHEWAQGPAVYVLVQYDFAKFRRTGEYASTASWYRVVFNQGCLVIDSFLSRDHDPSHPEGGYFRNAILDTTLRPELLKYDLVADVEEVSRQVEGEFADYPYFVYCCIGYWYPEARELTTVLGRRNGRKEDICTMVDENTTIVAPELAEYLRHNFNVILGKHPDYLPPPQS